VKVERLAVVGLGLPRRLGPRSRRGAQARRRARGGSAPTRSADAAATALAARRKSTAFAPIAEVARGADLAVLATPVGADGGDGAPDAPGFSRRDRGVVITDVGSVKASLVDTLPGLLPPGCCYVGSHPMAGSHHRGMSHAHADLFEGAVCVVTEAADPRAGRARVEAFWEALGAPCSAPHCGAARRRGRLGEPSAASARVRVWRGSLAAAAGGRPPSSPARASGTSPGSRAATPSSGPTSSPRTARRSPAPLGAAGSHLEAIAKALQAGDRGGVGPATLGRPDPRCFRRRRRPVPQTDNRYRAAAAAADRSKGDSD